MIGETKESSDGASDHHPANLASLCEVVSGLVEEGEFERALGVATAALVLNDMSAYGSLAQHALGAQPGVTETARRLRDMRVSGELQTAGHQGLYDAVRHCPIALLPWLDDETMFEAGQNDFAPWVGVGDVQEVNIGPEARRLGLRDTLARLFLSRQDPTSPVAPIAAQHVHPEFFVRHWHVVPEVPDPAQPSRKVAVGNPIGAFARACSRVRARSVLNIYVAEFDSCPVFESKWVPGTEHTGWMALGLANARDIEAQALVHLQRATTLGADMVLLPELTMPPLVREAVENWLHDRAVLDEAPGHRLQWVVCGSFHEDWDPSQHPSLPRNRSVVLDAFGEAVELELSGSTGRFEATKLTAVDYLHSHHVYEANRKGDRLLLVRSALGLLAVIICLDLAQAAVTERLPLEHLPLRWLWVPSLSPQVTAHQERAEALCRHRMLTVACANQGRADFGGAIGLLDGERKGSFAWSNQQRRSGSAVPLQEGPDWKLIGVPA